MVVVGAVDAVDLADMQNGSGLISAVARVRSQGAMNPLLWLAGIVVPISLVLIVFADPEWKQFFAILAVAMVVAPLGAYFWFMCRDRDRLQSEDYQLERHRMALLGDDFLGKAKQGMIIDQTPSPNPNAVADGGAIDG